MKAKIKDIGFLVKTSQYSESSLILKAFTRQHGMISILAKGIRKKQDVNLIQPLCEYEFSLYEPMEGGLFLLSEFSLLTNYNYTSNVERWTAAECALELYTQLIIPSEENPAYYDLLKLWVEYLRNMESNTILVWWRFLLRVFQMLGIPFQPDLCNQCLQSERVCVSFQKSTLGLICAECQQNNSEPENTEILSSQSSFILSLLPQISNYLETVKPDISTVKQLNGLFAHYYGSHFNTALKLRSLSVLEQFYS